LVYKPDTGQVTRVSGVLGSANVRSALLVREAQSLLVISRGESELLWVGTTQGLYVGNSDNWETVPDLEHRTITALAWDGNARSLWVGTDLGLFRLVSQDNGWNIANEFNVHNSGLGANRVSAIAIGAGDSGETNLWVGTPCGLSYYSY
jgi:ligand-binding sensor domain-containing protein